MVTRVMTSLLVVGALSTGCAYGTGTEAVELSDGLYELATVAMDSTCALEDALTEGPEYVGKIHQVRATVRESSVKLEVCDSFFEDCFSTVGEIGLIRQGDELFASDPHWQVPTCQCWESYTASRDVKGGITEIDKAKLTWTFSVPAPPADCWCDEWTACEATVEQLLSRQ